MVRNETQLLPQFTAELEEIRKNGINEQLLNIIIEKHRLNSQYNKELYKRYMAIQSGVPIFERQPRYKEEENPINNRVNTNFFAQIVNFKVGYLAGKPIAYGYSDTDEAEAVTGGKKQVDAATKAITDFVMRNNMASVDMTTTKNATIYGYSGRLFYIDKEGNERVRAVHGYETIILSDIDISEPEYAIRYYQNKDLHGREYWIVEFYDNKNITTYKGDLKSLEFVETKPHLFDYCPLQGIANNDECMGDAEAVIEQIDAYDKIISDNVNEVEAFAHAYLVFEGLYIDEKTIKEGQASGAFNFPATGTQQGKAYYLTKNINDAFTQHTLETFEDNIFGTTSTPNMKDTTFGTASGEALKFKLHGLETKCSVCQGHQEKAQQYMWKVLASAWKKKGIIVEPLQCTADYTRNFPLSTLQNAQAAQALIGAGVPKKIAWTIAIPEIDDPDYVEEMAKEEKEEAMSLFEAAQDMAKDGTPDDTSKKKDDEIDDEEE